MNRRRLPGLGVVLLLLLAGALGGVVGCGDSNAPARSTEPLPPHRIPRGK